MSRADDLVQTPSSGLADMPAAISNPNSHAARRAAKAGDYVAGAGGGGILVFSAQHFIPDESLRQLATYACPGISMFLVGFYQRLSGLALSQWNYFLSDLQKKRQLKQTHESEEERARLLKQVQDDIERCKQQFTNIEKRATASEAHKLEISEKLEKLEKIYVDLLFKGAVKIS